jgi:hypothetical protein
VDYSRLCRLSCVVKEAEPRRGKKKEYGERLSCFIYRYKGGSWRLRLQQKELISSAKLVLLNATLAHVNLSKMP